MNCIKNLNWTASNSNNNNKKKTQYFDKAILGHIFSISIHIFNSFHVDFYTFIIHQNTSDRKNDSQNSRFSTWNSFLVVIEMYQFVKKGEYAEKQKSFFLYSRLYFLLYFFYVPNFFFLFFLVIFSA